MAVKDVTEDALSTQNLTRTEKEIKMKDLCILFLLHIARNADKNTLQYFISCSFPSPTVYIASCYLVEVEDRPNSQLAVTLSIVISKSNTSWDHNDDSNFKPRTWPKFCLQKMPESNTYPRSVGLSL